jgi:hypothetical protein
VPVRSNAFALSSSKLIPTTIERRQYAASDPEIVPMPKLMSHNVRLVAELNQETSMMGVILSLRVATMSFVLGSIPLVASVAIFA